MLLQSNLNLLLYLKGQKTSSTSRRYFIWTDYIPRNFSQLKSHHHCNEIVAETFTFSMCSNISFEIMTINYCGVFCLLHHFLKTVCIPIIQVENVITELNRTFPADGLLPIYINPHTGTSSYSRVTFGAMGDRY